MVSLPAGKMKYNYKEYRIVVYVFSLLVAPLMVYLMYIYCCNARIQARHFIQHVPAPPPPVNLSSVLTTQSPNPPKTQSESAMSKTMTNLKDPLPDCMNLRRTKPYPNTGTPIEGSDLCATFQGTNRTDCTYYHPEVFNFALFTNNPSQSVLDFYAYLAIYSVDKFYKPDKIVIHCNNEIESNIYWEKLQKLSTPLETKHADRIKTIGKDNSKPRFITHEVDYFKISHALKYGGIYSDFDIVVLNGTRLREMQRLSEVMFGSDNSPCSRTCAGFISCVPGSPLLRKWLDSYENDYRPRKWIYNAGETVSTALRECTECFDVTVDRDISNYDEHYMWLMKEDRLKWKIKPVAHYMSKGFMKDRKLAPKELLKMNSPFTDMVKHVLGDTVKDFEQL